jgi:thioredoxin-like negative regulator of GroEL
VVRWAFVLCVWLGAGAARAEPVPQRSRAEILLERGERALAHGQTFEAEGDFRDAIQQSPRDPRGYLALAGALLARAAFAHAHEVLNAAERLFGAHEPVLLLRAEIFTREARLGEARRSLRAGLTHMPSSIALLRALAPLLERMGRYTEALATQRKLANCAGIPNDLRAEAILHARALSLLLGPLDLARAFAPH